MTDAFFDPGAYDPDKLKGEVGRLGALSQHAESSRADAMKKYRGTTEDTVRAIEEATQALRTSREDRWNLPALSFASGMLRTTPGVAGNFASELSQGIGAAVPAIQRQRMSDQEYYTKLAELQAEKGKIAGAPEKLEAEFQGKISAEAQKLLSQISMAGAKLEKPITVPSTGEIIFRDPKGGGFMVRKLDGTVVPLAGGASTGPAATPTPTPFADKTVDELLPVIQKAVPSFTPIEGVPYDMPYMADLATRDPGRAGIIAKVAHYDLDPKDITSGMAGGLRREELIKEVQRFNPKYEPANFPVAQKAKTELTTGKTGQSINSFNMTIHHLHDWSEAVNALNNGNIPLFNMIANKLGVATGKGAPAAADAMGALVAEELVKYLTSTGGGVEERAKWENRFSNKLSPEQVKLVSKEVVGALYGKADPLAATKTAAMGNLRQYKPDDLLTPKTKASLDAVLGNKDTGAAVPQAPVNAPPVSMLKDGIISTFKDGSKWTLRDGVPVKVP